MLDLMLVNKLTTPVVRERTRSIVPGFAEHRSWSLVKQANLMKSLERSIRSCSNSESCQVDSLSQVVENASRKKLTARMHASRVEKPACTQFEKVENSMTRKKNSSYETYCLGTVRSCQRGNGL